ncbi:hypothetical protein [Novosphingobium sp.]|uniref:hypothetical protein n=1 Tax=Novosphingobium sp. TaxID=1874826 RepID=UPI003BAB178C
MRANDDTLREAAEMLTFEHFPRTGRLLDANEMALSFERKFNPYHDPANRRFTTRPGGQGNPHEIVVYGRKPDKTGSTAPKWKAKSDAVRIPDAIRRKIDAVAADYHAATGKTLTVTDGMRTPIDQAERIYYKFSYGDFRTYRGAQGAELARLYRGGIASGKSKSQILAGMAAVVDLHLKQGRPISKHLLGMGLDFRVSDMNQTERDALRNAVRNNGGKPLDEGIPPHIHASF